MKPPGSVDSNDLCFPDRARPPMHGRASRPVVDPAGRTWPSLTTAALAYRLTVPAVRYRATNFVGGWHFAAASKRTAR
jgi:hypothetical protein